MDDVRKLFAMSPAAMLVVAIDAPDFTIMEVTDCYLRLVSREREELIGRPLFEAFPDGPFQRGAQAAFSLRSSIEQAIAAGRVDRMPILQCDLPGFTEAEECWWDPTNTPLRDAGGHVAAIVHQLTDVTERERAQAELRAQAAGQAFRVALEERLRRQIEPAAMLEAATALLGEHLGVAQVGFAEVEDDQAHIVVARDWNDGRIASVVGRWRMDDFGPSFIREMKTGETIVIPDIARDPRTNATEIVSGYEGINARAILNVPLIKNGRMVALLFIHHPELRVWSPAEISLVEDTCDRLWSAVQRGRAEADRARGDALRAAQTSVLQAAVDDISLPQALDALVRTVEGLSRSGMLASILLLDDDGAHLRHGAGPSLPSAYNAAIDGIAIGPAAGSCGTAAFLKRPVHVSDIGSDPLWADFRDLALGHGLWACWSTPILAASGAVLGTFAMYHDEPRAPAPADLELVEFIVRSAGLMIERKRAEARLKESEARTSFVLQAGRLGAWELNVRTGELTTSDTCRLDFGRAADEAFTYQQLCDAVHPEDRPRMADSVERSLRTGEDYDIEYRVTTPDGALRWIQIRAKPTCGPDMRPLSLTGVSLDVTDRHAAEAALRVNEARLRLLSQLNDALQRSSDAPTAMREAAALLAERLAASRCAYADVDPDNDRFVIRHDYAAPGIASSVGTYNLDLFGPRAAVDMRAGRTLVVCNVTSELSPESGRGMFQAIGIEAIICCPLVKDGRLAALMAVHQDRPRHWTADDVELVEATVERCWAHVERVGAEARLRDSEKRLRLSVENAEIGFWDVDMIDNTLIWPVRTKEMFGLPPDALVTIQDFYDGLHPDDSDETVRAYVAAANPERRALYDVEYRTVGRADSVVRWVAAKGRGVFDGPGPDARCLRVTGTAIEVTARKRAELALLELNATLEQRVADTAAERDRTWKFARDLLLVIGRDGIIRAVNPAWTAVLGWRGHELVGRTYLDFVHPDDHPSSQGALVEASKGPLPAFENRYRHKDGSWRWLSWVAAPEGDSIYASARDVTSDKARATELAHAQEALRQSQKMEAMGSLTGGVAHDFNNLLTPIVGSLDLLQRRGVGGAREQRLIAGAIQSAERAKLLVQRLLAFARRQPLQSIPVDLGALVKGMGELVASTTGPQIRIAVDVAADLPAAFADPNQLEMALLNLAVNARDAMPDGGTLRITAAAEYAGAGHVAALAPGRYVRLSVADTGTGMDEETLKRAVEPFFSTKGIGKGTGLGLSMVHGLAQQLGGGLTIQSRPGMGTNIELWLPESAAPAEMVEAVAASIQPAAVAGSALIVDDEDAVRMSTAEMLSDLGFAVTEASSAEEALALVRGGFRPRLIMADHLMPGMNGTDFARTIRSEYPDISILLVSGFAESEGVAPDLARLTKPFRNEELAASVAGLLAKPADAHSVDFPPNAP